MDVTIYSLFDTNFEDPKLIHLSSFEMNQPQTYTVGD